VRADFDGVAARAMAARAVEVRSHTDLRVLMPETVMIEAGWPLDEKAQSDIDDKKRKASKEIRIDALRDAIEFAQRTSGRGRGKAVLVYPAERMNHVTANALLKTLEEPPGEVRFVLATESAHQLLPTIRSRCLGHALEWPAESDALAWLQGEGVAAEVAGDLLRAAGGRPADALRLHRGGLDPRAWARLPKALQQGDVSGLGDWGPAEALDAVQKVCHDVLAVQAGAAPRFFQPGDLPRGGTLASLTEWSRDLARLARTIEHPYNPGLLLEALVSRARAALNSG
jgi:DNA polymerase III subunit delta'